MIISSTCTAVISVFGSHYVSHDLQAKLVSGVIFSSSGNSILDYKPLLTLIVSLTWNKIITVVMMSHIMLFGKRVDSLKSQPTLIFHLSQEHRILYLKLSKKDYKSDHVSLCWSFKINKSVVGRQPLKENHSSGDILVIRQRNFKIKLLTVDLWNSLIFDIEGLPFKHIKEKLKPNAMKN